MMKHLLWAAALIGVISICGVDRLKQVIATTKDQQSQQSRAALQAADQQFQQSRAALQAAYVACVRENMERDRPSTQDGSVLGSLPAFMVPQMADALAKANHARLEEIKAYCGG